MSDPIVKTVVLVRHGETKGNTDKIMYPPEEDLLSDNGKLEATLLSKRLKHIHFDKQYISNYPRTKQTADIILSNNEAKKNPPVIVEPRIREIEYSHSHGGSYVDVVKSLIRFVQTNQPLENFKIDDSENGAQLRDRTKSFVTDFLKDIFATRKNETILMVSHGFCIRYLMEAFSNKELFELIDWDEDSGLKVMKNTSTHKIVIKESDTFNEDNGLKYKIQFEELHNTSHIPSEMLANDSQSRLIKTPYGKCLSGCFQV